MKLGKKAAATEKTAATSNAPSKAPAKQKTNNPTLYLLMALLLALVGAGLTAVMLIMGVVNPAQRDIENLVTQERAQAAAALVSRNLKRIQSEVASLSTLALLSDAMGDDMARREAEINLTQFFPHAERVDLTPMGRAQPDPTGSVPLSFAGVDLIRRAETGKPTPAEAFLSSNHWYIQAATAIRHAQSNELVGTLLVVFSDDVIKEALADSPASAKMAVVQTVGAQTRVIAGQGGDPGEGALEVATSVPSWSLRYANSAAVGPQISQSGIWAALGAGLLLTLVGILLAFQMLQKLQRRDVLSVAGYLQSGLQGERSKEPQLKLGFLDPLMTVMRQHLRSGAAKRVEKVAAAVEPSRAPAPEPESDRFADPLFQNNDVLDINMLEGDEDLLGLDEPVAGTAKPVVEVAKSSAKSATAATKSLRVPAEIFRAYDIRGLVGTTLTEDIVYQIGRALGSEASERGCTSLCVGYDGRESSPVLADALVRGLSETGMDVINIGMVPTPVLYFSTYHLNTGSGVMITGSHNPSQYNGLKMMLAGETLASDDIQGLYRRIREGRFVSGSGHVAEADVRRDYLEAIIGDIAVAAPLKVVVDAGNGVAGELGPMLVGELGCEVIPMYCEIDGRFPNHHPDPGKPENLKDLIARVRAEGADLGIAFDGDGDRIGVVTNEGKIIWPDRLLMLFAKDVVSRNPGADVIFDVKCTRRLNALISGYGGRPIMWKTGHSLIKGKMKETGALLAGEMSGHIFFKERWYGFDDGIYSAARLLEILGTDERSCHDVFAAFPEDVSTPEINIDVTEASKFGLVERLAQNGSFGDGNMSTIDGVRVDYPDGWGLCRASNTTPVLVLRFEADNAQSLVRIQQTFREQLLAVDANLAVPF